MQNVSLDHKIVGDNYPCYIIAEIGLAFTNLEEAKRLIDSAIEIGADAVKFQTFDADTFTIKKNRFNLDTTGDVEQSEFLRPFQPSKELQKEVVQYAKEKNITVFSAPSHNTDVDLMEELGIEIYKIGSDLACHIPLLRRIARFGKPIIISTGMCTLEEIRDSVKAIRDEGNEKIILMHCVADYPSKIDEANLRAIETMKKEFNIPVGYSDHTLGLLTTISGVAMGANLIERHFRDIRNTSGPDDKHALVKEGFEELIQSIRDLEKAKGTGIKEPTKHEKENLKNNRVSIIAIKEILKGQKVSKDVLDIRRPGFGIQPKFFDEIIGKESIVDIPAETPIKWEMLKD